MANDNYRKLIERALPGSLVEHIGNVDDFNEGYYIAPKPGHFIRFLYDMGDHFQITIDTFIIQSWAAGTLDMYKYKRIFRGTVPATKDIKEPDFDFIEQLLRNYQNLG